MEKYAKIFYTIICIFTLLFCTTQVSIQYIPYSSKVYNPVNPDEVKIYKSRLELPEKYVEMQILL